MKRCVAWIFSAGLAVGLALLLTVAFEIVEISDENASSDFQPGERVLVCKLNVENIGPGDLVFCRMPFHQPGASGLYCLRRVADADGAGFSVCKSIGDMSEDHIKIGREDVVGRVLVKVP